ncbi:MAG: substrate-binding domain-containing protein [Lachnospiraceae bacterium]|nr:substrate-binding domain-containing protein [Lachnospiraceae bacterium]
MKRTTIVLFASAAICSVLLVLVLSFASRSAAGSLPDLSSLGYIHAVVREDGSGTKAQFDALVSADESVDGTKKPSTNDVITEVGQDRQAVGYAAFSSLNGNAYVRPLAIDGVAPSQETFRNGTYPLTRNYYVAWSGALNEVGRDFVRYIMTAGQAIIDEETNAVTAASPFRSLMPAGSLTISGSTSIEPLMGKLIEDYMNYNPAASISLAATDSSRGLKAAEEGKCDLAISSRDLTKEEKNDLSCRMIAVDGVAVIVNAKNPVTSLTKKQLRSIYSGDAEVWEDLADIR